MTQYVDLMDLMNAGPEANGIRDVFVARMAAVDMKAPERKQRLILLRDAMEKNNLARVKSLLLEMIMDVYDTIKGDDFCPTINGLIAKVCHSVSLNDLHVPKVVIEWLKFELRALP